MSLDLFPGFQPGFAKKMKDLHFESYRLHDEYQKLTLQARKIEDEDAKTEQLTAARRVHKRSADKMEEAKAAVLLGNKCAKRATQMVLYQFQIAAARQWAIDQTGHSLEESGPFDLAERLEELHRAAKHSLTPEARLNPEATANGLVECVRKTGWHAFAQDEAHTNMQKTWRKLMVDRVFSPLRISRVDNREFLQLRQ